MGKSLLVRRALGAAGAGTGGCPPSGNAPALWAWSQALGEAGRPDVAYAVDAALTAGLAPGHDVDPGALASARFAAVAAAARLVLQAARVDPLVLVLEDLHWADAGTLSLLDQVGQSAARYPLLVVATTRDEQPLRPLLRQPAVVALRLPPLTPGDVAVVLAAAGAGELGPAEVCEGTAGVPLLVDAVARAGTLRPTTDVRAVAEDLLAQVPEEHRAVLRCAALLEGDGDSPTDLAHACGVPDDEVAVALEAGRAAGLLGTADGDPRRFRHVLLRDAVAAGLPVHRAREVHRVAARALAGRAEADERLAADTAAHWAAAGSDAEALSELVRWSLVAGRRALAALAPDDAVRHLAAAVEAQRRLGAPDGDLAAALVELAEAQYLAGVYPAALATCEEASSRAEASGSAELVVAAALVVRWVTYPEAAHILARLARRALSVPDVAPAVRARVLAQLATMHADDGRGREARRLGIEALTLAEREGDPMAIIDAARAREMTLVHPTETPERLRLGELVVRHCTRLGQPLGVVTGHTWRLRAAFELASFSVIEDGIRCIAVLAETSGLPLARWHHLRVTAAVAALEGRFGAAREANSEACELAIASGDMTALGLSRAHSQHLALLRGDVGELPDGLEEELLRLPPLPLLLSARAVHYTMLGRLDDARALYERLLPFIQDDERDARRMAVVMDLLHLADVFGDGATAAALLPELEPYATCPGTTRSPTVFFSGSPRRYLGRAYALMGRLDDAVAALRGAIAVDATLGARPAVVWSRLDLAAALLRRAGPGDLREAASSAREAAREARRLDMPGPLARADQLAAAIAAAERSSSPFSVREAEVAELVLAGLSNRAIAQRLVLSERTVESHVSAVLRKSGAATRTEYLAQRAHT